MRARSIKHSLIASTVTIQDRIPAADWDGIAARSRHTGLDRTEQVDPMRDIIASCATNGRLNIPDATECLEAFHWLDRVSHHIARISLHIQPARMAGRR